MVSYVYFKVANERDSELEACEYLDVFAKKCGFNSDTIDEMRLAFIEGLINAREHSPKDPENNSDPSIHVAFSYENEMLEIKIRDYGIGFDPRVVEKPDIKKKLRSSRKRGWGLMLMERLMDGAEVSSFPPSGTLIKMVKKKITTENPTEADTIREHKRLERLRYILGSFIDLSSFLCQNQNLQIGLRSMLRILLGTLGVSRGAIYTFDDNNQNLSCLVDIKLKAQTKLPQIKISPEIFEKMSSKHDSEVVDIFKNDLQVFSQAFSNDEIELVYVLKTDIQTQGVLILGNRFKKNGKNEEPIDKELLTTLSRNISSAINTFRLMMELKEANESLDLRIKELNAVREASQTISSELELANIPFTVESIFKSIMNIDKFSMALYEPTENRFIICSNNRELPISLDLWSSPVSQHVVQKMEPIFVPDLRKEERFNYPRAKSYSSNSFIVIPIVAQDEVLGLINITDKDTNDELTSRDFELAKLLCSQLSIALKNANLYKKGITDSLTRLYTNHYFKMRLSQEISRLRRVKCPLAIIMVAIDNIDALLKEHGSSFKDALLIKIGSMIRKVIRFNDLPCRFEGDKFSIILPDTTLDGAKSAAEKLMKTIKSSKFKQGEIEKELAVTISVLEFDVSMNINQFVDAADRLIKKGQAAGGKIIVSS